MEPETFRVRAASLTDMQLRLGILSFTACWREHRQRLVSERGHDPCIAGLQAQVPVVARSRVSFMIVSPLSPQQLESPASIPNRLCQLPFGVLFFGR